MAQNKGNSKILLSDDFNVTGQRHNGIIFTNILRILDWSTNETLNASFPDLSEPTTNEYIFDHPSVRITLYLAYAGVFCLSFFGNLLVIAVMTLHWRMRNVTKFCVGNLAFANFCVSIFCIFQNLSTFLQENWIFGRLMCKMYYFTNSLSHTASILILEVICIERYVSIVHPLRVRQMLTMQRLRFIIAGVWLLSGIISCPRLYYFSTFEAPSSSTGETEVVCAPVRTLYSSKAADMISFVLLFLLPLLIMSVVYAKIARTLWQSTAVLQSVTNETRSIGAANVPPPIRRAQTIVMPQNLEVQETRLEANESNIINERPLPKLAVRHSAVGQESLPRPSSSRSALTGGRRVYENHQRGCNAPEPGLVTHVPSNRIIRRGSLAVQTGSASTNNIRGRCEGSGTPGQFDQHQRVSAVTVVSQVRDERQGKVVQSRRAAIRMLIVIVITFALCNFPYHVRKICQYYVPGYNIQSEFHQFITPVTFLLMYANCALNPILYAFMSKNFRSSLNELLMLQLRRPVTDLRACRRMSF